ncbi:MAG: hypothetical protein J1E36_01220 [Eubacterium sp.]|nr:hypothetical protein [Eubacterium sp.]
MAKKGMKRPERTHTKARNDAAAVPEIQGKAKHGNVRVRPIIAGTEAPSQKVYHMPSNAKAKNKSEKPISDAYSVIDNDLARDNLENDITDADLQDL